MNLRSFLLVLVVLTLATAGFAQDVGGTHSGPYTFTYDPDFSGPCNPVSGTGVVQFDLQQSGTDVVGLVYLYDFPFVGFDDTGACETTTQLIALPVSGYVSGTYLEVSFVNFDPEDGNHVYFQFFGFVDGDSFDGYIEWFYEEEGAAFMIGEGFFSAGRGAEAFPRITSFEASPAEIVPGQSTRLIWSTTGADSVEISGIGPVAANGSVAVSPTHTTTYTLTATGNGTVTNTVTVTVPDEARIIVTSYPEPLAQIRNSGGSTTSYTIRNDGGQATQLNLSKDAAFFSQSPESFVLQPGASQEIQITGNPNDDGYYLGASIIQGAGVPADFFVPVTMLVRNPPNGPASAAPVDPRVEVSAPPEQSPSGVVQFKNTGEHPVRAVATSSAAWLVPQQGMFGANPGETLEIPFTIDRSRRPADSEIGSLSASLILTYLQPSAGKGIDTRNGLATSSTLVTVVDTARPPVAPGEIPPLGLGEVALFVPGVGHVEGSVGVFLSDLTISNLTGTRPVENIAMYYTASGQTSTLASSVSSIPTTQPVNLADIVEDVFQQTGQIGSLQLRGDVRNLGVNATIFNVSNPEGTYGTTIPTLRSDRSVAAGESTYLTGLRKTATAHTNLYIQETMGGTVTGTMRYLAPDGTQIGTGTFTAGPFQLLQVGNVLPAGTVSAIVTADELASGQFAAYATPVDKLSGDTWAVVDWNEQFAFSGGQAQVIPIAGAVPGANQTYFRTDVAIMSRDGAAAQGTLRYLPRGGTPIERPISLAANETRILDDIVTEFFDVAPGTVGFIQYVPASGSVTMTSRTFTTVAGSAETFGSGQPTFAAMDSLSLGESRRIGGIEDAAVKTVTSGTPGTFRSNFGFLETSGKPVTVRVTLHFSYAAGSLATGRGNASRDFVLQPNELQLLTGISSTMLGPQRNTLFGNLSNLQADFSVIGGEGEVLVFVSSVDNGTGDSILRME